MCAVPTTTPHVTSPSPLQPEKKSRRKFDFPIETLEAYSHYRQDEAAKRLGVSSITLKRNCQRRQYRWPYRTIKAKARRAARLEAQRLQNKTSLDVQMTPPSSPSTLAPELLLHLREGNKKAFNSSPTSVSNAPSPIYPTSSPTAQFPHQAESVTLPPLSLLLAKHRLQSVSATPDAKRQRYHHRDMGTPVNYKSPFYAASFEPNAPRFPLGRLAALSLAGSCDAERRGF
ncbi:hypothetical protein PR003_g19884 [Phytophthora rubi]|uniref:RWP-RK domain-containing protein n=1 Tax=Phytophthora rubi TaxID=129364 RepID=A0A6A3KD74_9STRA|nr:hypothetical protein PR002_g18906 [Phytophthora rubi]KAE9001853.1 hypothetical protein PR001_g18411 [Phytophthora rubi]KAE9311966.1 hypothetical protein PR003_g19884 [Phytophthora rubi]